MKTATCIMAIGVAVLAITWTGIEAAPTAAEEPKNQELTGSSDLAGLTPPEGRSNRVRRVTCDLFSFQSKWFTPNHAACAAHCLALNKGFKGGTCQNGVCVCRK